jgi:hypothetical protein
MDFSLAMVVLAMTVILRSREELLEGHIALHVSIRSRWRLDCRSSG